jgi:hypothetical protein
MTICMYLTAASVVPMAWLLCLTLEISILLFLLHSKLSNKVIFRQPGLVYSLVIFCKTDLVICHLQVILLTNESSELSCVAI